MTDDIVTRLRQYIPPKPYNKLPKSVEDMQEAADEIERLRIENAHLRHALKINGIYTVDVIYKRTEPTEIEADQ